MPMDSPSAMTAAERAALTALVVQWRKQASVAGSYSPHERSRGVCDGQARCADELAAALDLAVRKLKKHP